MCVCWCSVPVCPKWCQPSTSACRTNVILVQCCVQQCMQCCATVWMRTSVHLRMCVHTYACACAHTQVIAPAPIRLTSRINRPRTSASADARPRAGAADGSSRSAARSASSASSASSGHSGASSGGAAGSRPGRSRLGLARGFLSAGSSRVRVGYAGARAALSCPRVAVPFSNRGWKRGWAGGWEGKHAGRAGCGCLCAHVLWGLAAHCGCLLVHGGGVCMTGLALWVAPEGAGNA